MSEREADTHSGTQQEHGTGSPQPAPRPVYRKPTIRTYDQIEQVKPYGPSEKQAG